MLMSSVRLTCMSILCLCITGLAMTSVSFMSSTWLTNVQCAPEVVPGPSFSLAPTLWALSMVQSSQRQLLDYGSPTFRAKILVNCKVDIALVIGSGLADPQSLWSRVQLSFAADWDQTLLRWAAMACDVASTTLEYECHSLMCVQHKDVRGTACLEEFLQLMK